MQRASSTEHCRGDCAGEKKRGRAAEVQDPPAPIGRVPSSGNRLDRRISRSVVECASPLALLENPESKKSQAPSGRNMPLLRSLENYGGGYPIGFRVVRLGLRPHPAAAGNDRNPRRGNWAWGDSVSESVVAAVGRLFALVFTPLSPETRSRR